MSAEQRRGHCTDEDAFEVRGIEVSFAIPVQITQEQNRRLVDLITEITKAPYNQIVGHVHWLAGMGSKPHFSQADSHFLGLPVEPGAPETGEPTWDDSVYMLGTTCRESWPKEEAEELRRYGGDR